MTQRSEAFAMDANPADEPRIVAKLQPTGAVDGGLQGMLEGADDRQDACAACWAGWTLEEILAREG